MIIYNITTLVSWAIHDEWRKWMDDVYLPEIMSTELFSRCQFVRLIEANEDDGATYALQLYLDSISSFSAYRNKYLSKFQQKEKNTWGDDATSFASLMEVIN